ncbi:MAG: hypothetical protein ACPGVA_03535 [Pikeienuella sp.]
MTLRIMAVVMAAMGGARVVRGLFNGLRVDWLGVALIAAGTIVLIVMVWAQGGEISVRTLAPAIRGAVRALVGAAF